MSMKINVVSLSISPEGQPEIDYVRYAQKRDEPIDPFVEVEFVDEEEGFVGLYPGIAEPYGVKIDRTTAASMLRLCRLLHEHRGHTHRIDYALNGATISISNDTNVENYVELAVNVHQQFVWSADMSIDSLRIIGEGLEYALEQFEASLVGRDASETARTANQLLLEQERPVMVPDQPMTPEMTPESDDWGSDS